MIQLRLVVPAELTEQVLSLLDSLASAMNIDHLAGAARDPNGDLVLAAWHGRELARRSLAALLVGFPIAIVSTYAAAVTLRALDVFPEAIGRHTETLFISDPNRYSVIVAVIAGVAGMVSLTTAKAGALIGGAGLGDDDPGGRERRRGRCVP